ncbi:type II toxin-antitoxin system RelE/ParE family toxin [Mesorhizobium sp. LHD-90]|uniref:type II toxin-antitoxin system RelE/ParE family toxin n=1 Tax=Mesorhizobium sp. LHD-90 TaxID=3071414 RepID=UPI0027E0FAEC|nr:type II toxin-antitoxin system RelE/ParE family toxin [Mesorhizobium sp. LHD-90]MDQ6437420.1 type II toxin-antitoxin system RelE/ParE family toxin [Mesorhizobium sp. LHD-90]
MARLRFTADAQDDLINITAYVARQSGSRVLATAFRRQLRQKCEQLASLPGIMGRERNELRDGLRSSVFKSYVIFYRYLGDDLEVVNILEGHRDMGTFFGDE